MTDTVGSGRATIYLNGKFTAQLMSGVQRVAWRLLAALDDEIPEDGPEWVLLCPREVRLPSLRRISVRAIGPAGLQLHVWEQVVLPWTARGGLLLSLIGSAPWFGGRLACIIHDAAVFDYPQAYTRGFAWWYRALFKRVARRAEVLLTVSEFSRVRLAHHLRLPPRSISIIPNGANHFEDIGPDEGMLRKLGLEGVPFFLAVASSNPAKNLTRLYAAFHDLASRHVDVCLVIAGGGNARVYAPDESSSSHPRVISIGPAGDSELCALYDQAIALVFPSLYEGFGLPPVEAMSRGCPVITSDIPPLREVCGEAARYVDPSDPMLIARAMEQVLVDPAMRARLREAGRERAAGYTWRASASRLLEQLGMPPAVPSTVQDRLVA